MMMNKWVWFKREAPAPYNEKTSKEIQTIRLGKDGEELL